MKKIIKLLTAAIFCAAATSCDDWLDDVQSKTSIDDSVVFNDESSIDSYVFGFYTYIDKWGQLNTNSYQCNGSLTESLTDALKYGTTAQGTRGGHPFNYATNYNQVTPDQCLYDNWSKLYEQIRRINQFIHLLHQYSAFPQEKNDRWEAEARFFRAYLYFQVARRHPSGCIKLTDLPTTPDNPLTPGDQIWDFILEDLHYGADGILPEKWDSANTGRVTQGAAWALISRVALYAENWQEAYDAAVKCESYGYALVSSYSQAWKGNNSEAILQFSYNTADPKVGPYTQFDSYYVPACDGVTFGGTGTPTQEMVESYEDKTGAAVDWSPWHGTTTTPPPYDRLEPRFAATVIYPGSYWKGKKMDNCVGGTNGEFMNFGDDAYANGRTTTGYYLRKLLDESNTNVAGTYSTQPWVEIRFAEVLLNKAEAAYRLGNISEAQAAMNRVRARVGLPGKFSIGETWFKDYRNERKIELAYEGHLFWDMRRWKLAHIEYNGFRMHGIKINNGTYEYVDVDNKDRVFNPKTYNLPIPTEELKKNKAIQQYDEWK